MPELPEVETMKRGLTEVVGRRIVRAEFPRCRLRPIGVEPSRASFARRVKNQTIVSLGRLGKRVIVNLSDDKILVFEPRMTGLVLVADPPNQTHLRLRLELADGPVDQLLYWDRRGLGSVKCLTREEFDQRYSDGRLGPDALQVTWQALQQRLGKSRREIKVALLDQRAVAGIGNLYAAEILHLCRLHPQQPCCGLTNQQWQRLQKATLTVLEEAIRYEGSTLSDGTYRNALNQSGGYQNEHRVYDRAGQACPTCQRGEIKRIVQAQRATFYCPRCQVLRG